MRISDWSSDVCSSDLLFAVGNELVELRTVARELGAFVEYLPEHTLDGDDFPTDDELAAKLFLKIGRGRKVIGMGMGLENPVDCEALFPNMGNDLVGGLEARPSGGLIEVPHAVDDRCPLCDGITDHVTCGARSEEHTSELQSLMRISYAVVSLQKK